jgi:hypothetical protein
VTEYEILIKPGAELDAEEISNWYENVLPGLGMQFLENYVQVLQNI